MGRSPGRGAQTLQSSTHPREKGLRNARVVEAALKAAGIQMKHTRVIMELDSTEAIKSAVEAAWESGLSPAGLSRKK